MFDGDFGCADDVFGIFCVSDADREGVIILYANYENEDYSGSAGVLFLKNGRLYTVYGAHCSCSCYGLEDQWEPEEVTLAEIRHYAGTNSTPSGIDFSMFRVVSEKFAHLDTSVLDNDQIAMLIKLSMG